MRQFALATAVIAAFALSGFASAPRIDYRLTPILEAGALTAVQIDLRFRGEADGETQLRLPQSWGGQEELWRSVEALTVVSGAELRDGDEPGERTLSHRPNARIHVRYRVIQDFEGAPNAREGNAYRAVVQPSYFHLIGNAALVTPMGADNTTRVRVTARLPRGWAFASDLEHPDLVLGDVSSSVIVGGDFRLVRAGDGGIRLAIRGHWSFNDEDLAHRVAGIVAGHRRFWDDPDEPYLVTLLPLESPAEGWLSIGGTGLGDAFAFFATANAESPAVTRLLAHEALHTWIPGRIGGFSQQSEAAEYWLSEGFTDYYTSRLLVRDGLWAPSDFAADLNTMLSAYAQSPARTATNARIVADFWRDRDVQQLPYQRGRLLAILWDARLRAAGRSLDEVMLGMRQRVRDGDERVAVALFAEVASSLGLSVAADLAAHVEQGAAIMLPADAFAPCGVLETQSLAPFHRGFDIEATTANNNVIAGVIRAGPAYAAGMRDGMTLVRRDAGEIGNSELQIAYVVRDGDVERTLRYMPRGPGSYVHQRLVLDGGLSGESLAACLRVLGGPSR
ncbi:MAG: hypothetical protein K2P58_07050 [Hyphomonadaceae bacterium]|nr:hypothetical protein [Hyphomonadaceae bacterium]